MKYFLPVCLLFIYTTSFAQKNVNPTFEKNITLDAFEIEIQREISDRIIAGAVYLLYHDGKYSPQKSLWRIRCGFPPHDADDRHIYTSFDD
jgi:hypothetical protein